MRSSLHQRATAWETRRSGIGVGVPALYDCSVVMLAMLMLLLVSAGGSYQMPTLGQGLPRFSASWGNNLMGGFAGLKKCIPEQR